MHVIDGPEVGSERPLAFYTKGKAMVTVHVRGLPPVVMKPGGTLSITYTVTENLDVVCLEGEYG